MLLKLFQSIKSILTISRHPAAYVSYLIKWQNNTKSSTWPKKCEEMCSTSPYFNLYLTNTPLKSINTPTTVQSVRADDRRKSRWTTKSNFLIKREVRHTVGIAFFGAKKSENACFIVQKNCGLAYSLLILLQTSWTWSRPYSNEWLSIPIQRNNVWSLWYALRM